MISDIIDHIPQLTRIIQINSGKADYVEIEPRNSTHLAADNGEGKSSILNALQFLMIDDWSRMKFPNGNDETAAFYFRGENSHLIFEIRDELNHFHQVWFSGRTSAVKDRYQRVVLSGKYAKELFIIEREESWKVLNFNEVLANCTARSISIEPFKSSTDLRKYLSENINWYPVSPDFQKRFFAVMRKLNQLSDMTPSDLKEVLIEVSQIKSTTLDFETEYRGTWSRLEHEGKVIDELRRKQSELDKLEKNLERENKTHKQLMEEIQSLAKAINAREIGVQSETSDLKSKIDELHSELSEIAQSIKENDRKRQDYDRKIGSLLKDIKQLDETKRWVSGVTKEELEKAKAESETKFFDLRERRKRYDGHSEANMSLDEVKARIEECNDDIEDINKKLGGLKDSIYSKLSGLGLTPDLTYWTKFNPDLLMMPGEITSELELMREIKSLSDDTGISLPGIEAVPQSLTKLDRYTNPEQLKRRFEEQKLNLDKWIQLEKDISNIEQLEREHKVADLEMKNAFANLQKFEDWNNKGIHQLKQFQDDLYQIEIELEDISEKQKELKTRDTSKDKLLSKLLSKLNDYNNQLQSCINDWENILVHYLGANLPTEGTQFSLEKVQKDIETCKNRIQDLERVKTDVLESRVSLNQLAIFLALDPSSEEFVTRALERFQTISVDEENLTNAWMNLQGSIVQKANLLKEGVVAVRRELNSINTRFKKTNVSNLELFEVNLIDNSSELKMFDSLSQLGGFAKFTRTDKEMEALENFKTEVSKKNKFYLARLFDLQFVIKNPGEELKEIKRLDFVGSTGTQTVVKTVLLLLLLSKFTRKRRKNTKIPVQLDEVGTLGPSNYSEILDVANALNFQMFTASPKSVASADIVYPLLKGSRKGRLFCDSLTGRPKPEKLIGEEE